MGFYNDVILPRLCDFAMRNKRLVPYRERVIGAAVALIDHVSPPLLRSRSINSESGPKRATLCESPQTPC